MAKIYLSPSVQENNKGIGNYGTEEYRMNQIADIVQSELKRHSLTVYRNKPSMNLSQIANDSNSHNVNLHLAIHSNAGGGSGCEVFCYKTDGRIGHEFAKKIYSKLSAITPTSDRGVKQGYNFYGTGKHMYEVTYTKAPAALVEVAFHDNENDAIWIINNIKKIGIELAKATLSQLGIKYKPSEIYPNMPYTRWGYSEGLTKLLTYKEEDKFTVEQIFHILKRFKNKYIK